MTSGPARPATSGAGRTGVGPRDAEGNVVEPFDGVLLDIEIKGPVACGRVNVAVDRAGLRKRKRQSAPCQFAQRGIAIDFVAVPGVTRYGDFEARVAARRPCHWCAS